MKDDELKHITQVVKLAQSGNEMAFEELYQTYYKKIKFIAYQMYNNNELANDIAQDVFIKVHKHLHKLKEPVTFPLWLYRIAYTTSLNHNRGKLRFTDLGETTTVEDFSHPKQKSADVLLDEQSIIDEIKRSFNKLSAPLKVVGMMRYFDDLSIEEISVILEIPKGTVNSRLHKARKLIKQDLIQRNITPRSYSIVLLPSTLVTTMFHQQYENFSKLILESNYMSYENVRQSIPKEPIVGFLSSIVTSKTIVVVSLVTAFTIGITQLDLGGIEHSDSSLPTNPVALDIEENAKIIQINYNQQWTNQTIALDIQTTNENYDEILISGNPVSEITSNGVYLIQLMKDDEMIDQREIEITNIDRYSPNGYGEQKENYCMVYLTDDVSNINYNSIKMFKNGVINNNYTVYKESGIITFTCEERDVDEINISDNANNWLNIEVH